MPMLLVASVRAITSRSARTAVSMPTLMPALAITIGHTLGGHDGLAHCQHALDIGHISRESDSCLRWLLEAEAGLCFRFLRTISASRQPALA